MCDHKHSVRVFQEYSLHLSAGDKAGVAFQMGSLMLLAELGLLSNVRYIHTSGLSNLLSIWMMSGLKQIGAMSTDTWGALSRCPAQRDWEADVFLKHFYTPVMNMLMDDQERYVMWKRLFCPWKWGDSYADAFTDWLTEAAPLDADCTYPLIDHKDAATMTLPIFTLNARFEESPQAVCVTTDRDAPAISTHVIESNPQAAATLPYIIPLQKIDTRTFYSFLTAASMPPGIGSDPLNLGNILKHTLVPSLDVDPFHMRTYHTFLDKINRGPQSPLINDNERCIVIDAYSNSYWPHGYIGSMLVDQQTAALKQAPKEERSELGRRNISRAALHDGMLIGMHPIGPTNCTPWLKKVAEADSGMQPLSADLAMRASNWGYYTTLRAKVGTNYNGRTLPHPDLDQLMPERGVNSKAHALQGKKAD